MQRSIHSAEEMKECAKEIIVSLLPQERSQALVLALTGDLGAGKTTFTQGVAEVLGIREAVVSPTFTIMRIYKIQREGPFSHLVHIDAYRLESADELIRLGWSALMKDPQHCIVVEWPERVSDCIPPSAHSIVLRLVSDTHHEISYQEN